MIPRTTWRITAPPLARRYLARSYTNPATPSSTPYGEEYGAGPSRLPYDPRSTHIDSSRRTTRKKTRDSAHLLRCALGKLPRSEYYSEKPVARLVAEVIGEGPLSRLEKHVLLHHLIRVKRGAIGVGFATRFVQERQLPGVNPHDSLLSSRSLGLLLSRKHFKTPGRPKLTPRTSPPAPDPLPQPTIAEQTPQGLSHLPCVLLAFLRALKENHHARPERLYVRLILQCANEGRPDEAAKVYVGLVEDWIMEGRVAEGANPADFARNGLPAKDRSEASNSLFDMWFGAVRTWRLPGEAMSLHDRLDLWHPQHAAPDHCLRGFPLPNPTSPPSQVPPPTVRLLDVILNSIKTKLDPHVVTPVEYATSMRALATLANTILSRSLPIPAIPELLKAFSNSHIHPAVYPDTYTEPPEHNAWAYTANTQVHVALVTLLFSPPNYARAAEIQQQDIDSSLPSPKGALRYSLHPLGWQSCMVLIKYATHKLRQPRLLGRLVEYMKETFAGWSPSVFNELFRGAIKTNDKQLAREIEGTLFAESPLSATGVEKTGQALGLKVMAKQTWSVSPHRSAPTILDEDRFNEDRSDEYAEDMLSLPYGTPDSDSVAALISHLTSMEEFDRLRKTVHILIPFLAITLDTDTTEVVRISELTGAEIGKRGRLRPSELTPELYAVIVNGLAKSGATGLSQRVFRLAEQAERRYIKRIIDIETEKAREQGNEVNATVSLSALQPVRLPNNIYTSMMYVYGSERKKLGTPRRGWNVPKTLELLSRSDAGRLMAKRLHRHVKRRYQYLSKAERALLPKSSLPDERYFNAVIRALHIRWNLDTSHRPENEDGIELACILNDMVELGLVPPEGLVQKLSAPYTVTEPIFFDLQSQPSEYVPEQLNDFRLLVTRASEQFVEHDPEEDAVEWTQEDDEVEVEGALPVSRKRIRW